MLRSLVFEKAGFVIHEFIFIFLREVLPYCFKLTMIPPQFWTQKCHGQAASKEAAARGSKTKKDTTLYRIPQIAVFTKGY